MKKNIVAIIPARGGSKGIPDKNIVDFCGRPLLSWTTERALQTKEISSVWVSSDSSKVLETANRFGANCIKRPDDISGDKATSESAWQHALDMIEKQTGPVDIVVAMQVTSPLRGKNDLSKGISDFIKNRYDSLFSASKIDDMFLWEKNNKGELESINYDHKNRKRRQDFSPQFVENGSFYIFKPSILRTLNNRLGGRIGMTLMDFWQMFEIDNLDDLRFCEVLMEKYILKKEGSPQELPSF
ncbi:acylneuraminate cytidylyltransferase family protein [Bacteriovoracales bacterium]|nr:acylneuraminate cytidylyltransferase family protein [Bacteriovoracales bacterium]